MSKTEIVVKSPLQQQIDALEKQLAALKKAQEHHHQLTTGLEVGMFVILNKFESLTIDQLIKKHLSKEEKKEIQSEILKISSEYSIRVLDPNTEIYTDSFSAIKSTIKLLRLKGKTDLS